ncbi:MAG: NADPH-dependent FMN reductase, partial [Fidelibacterota bacterium]
MEEIFIPILLGTARKNRQSEKVARFILAEAEKYAKFKSELIDVRDFMGNQETAAMDSGKSKKWSDIMMRADGLIIVSPEYNNCYPGELKIMLDEIYEEYSRKPVGMCGVSSGSLGGARMIEILRTTAIALQMTPINKTLYFSNVNNLFDEDGTMKN